MIKEAKYAIYKYSDKDSELINSINTYLEECIPDILRYFCFNEPTHKVSIIIFPTKKRI